MSLFLDRLKDFAASYKNYPLRFRVYVLHGVPFTWHGHDALRIHSHVVYIEPRMLAAHRGCYTAQSPVLSF